MRVPSAGLPCDPGSVPSAVPSGPAHLHPRGAAPPGPGELPNPAPAQGPGSPGAHPPLSLPQARLFPEGSQERRSPGAGMAGPVLDLVSPIPNAGSLGVAPAPGLSTPLPKHQGPPTACRGLGCPQHKAGRSGQPRRRGEVG